MKLWPEGERTEERDPGVAVGPRTRCLWRSRAKLAGERGKTAELGQTTFSYAKSMSFLPNYSPKFLLPHREQDWFICQWILATGDLNCPACHWYRHVEPSFSAHGSARAGEGWSGSPLAPSVHGTSSPTHILLHLAPAQQNRGPVPSWDNQLRPGGFKQAAPELRGDQAYSPPAGRGGGEDPCQGDVRHLPLQLPSQQQPGPTPNMQFAPESNNHCSWEKPHPLSLAGFSFSYGRTPRANPCSCP